MGAHVRESVWGAWRDEGRHHWAVVGKYPAEGAYKRLGVLGPSEALGMHTWVVRLEGAFREGKAWPA